MEDDVGDGGCCAVLWHGRQARRIGLQKWHSRKKPNMKYEYNDDVYIPDLRSCVRL